MRRMIRAFCIGLLIFLTACEGKQSTPTVLAVASPTPAPVSTTTSAQATLTPSATTEPAALKVNGEPVSLAEYQASLSQLAQAQPELSAAERRRRVLDELIDQSLLAQAAFKDGFSLSEDDLQKRIDQVASEAGGAQGLADWQVKMGYSAASFRSALRRASAAAWQRDRIAASVPAEAEQVHARQILLRSADAAQKVLQQAKNPGTNFATLAAGYDLTTRGDLSWFPRGYLNEPAVEEAAFALQPGQISEVIKSGIGYHIIQVIARETRPLTTDARLVLQRKAIAAWMTETRKSAQIEEVVP